MMRGPSDFKLIEREISEPIITFLQPNCPDDVFAWANSDDPGDFVAMNRVATLSQGWASTDLYWAGRTCRMLRNALRCRLVRQLDETPGFVVTTAGSNSFFLKPTARSIQIHCVADSTTSRPYCNLSIVQNKHQLNLRGSSYIPHWPHPGLVPRSADNQNRFKVVAYVGDPVNLAPELREPGFAKSVRDLGLTLEIVSPERWHDYSTIDAVLAVRSFGETLHLQKPASKLVNAWLAGVPAVMGMESAYRDAGRPGVDYLEVNSLEQTLQALVRLRDDLDFRHQLMERGREQGDKFSEMAVRQAWIAFFTQTATAYFKWWTRLSPIRRRFWLAERYLALRISGLRARFARRL